MSLLAQFRIGHYTDQISATGCTVILPPAGNKAAGSIRGASPATREFGLLSPQQKMPGITALLFTGGSAFGLSAAQGIMEAMSISGQGYATRFGVVPIIPAAVIYDLNCGSSEVKPGPEAGILAMEDARPGNYEMGCIGAGTGATVGKWAGLDRAMKGGLGLAEISHDRVQVAALAVVNAVGDITGYDGRLVAGAIDENQQFLAANRSARWRKPEVGLGENTVLVAVMTNAEADKQQLFYLAERAHFGIARRVVPSHTSYDGDVSVAMSAGNEKFDIDALADMTVLAVEEAILQAVGQAESMFGFKAGKDLDRK